MGTARLLGTCEILYYKDDLHTQMSSDAVLLEHGICLKVTLQGSSIGMGPCVMYRLLQSFSAIRSQYFCRGSPDAKRECIH